METTIHLRFSPSGAVTEIGERPAHMSPQEWFERLSRAGVSYEALAGGRGIFRVPSDSLDALRDANRK